MLSNRGVERVIWEVELCGVGCRKKCKLNRMNSWVRENFKKLIRARFEIAQTGKYGIT